MFTLLLLYFFWEDSGSLVLYSSVVIFDYYVSGKAVILCLGTWQHVTKYVLRYFTGCGLGGLSVFLDGMGICRGHSKSTITVEFTQVGDNSHGTGS